MAKAKTAPESQGDVKAKQKNKLPKGVSLQITVIKDGKGRFLTEIGSVGLTKPEVIGLIAIAQNTVINNS